jgi:hypothetical protein
MEELFSIDKQTKFLCDWMKYWSGVWAELRGLRNLVNIQKKRIDHLEKVFFSTHGG